MIKAFLFDYDGVMTPGVADGIPATRLASVLNVSEDQASEWIRGIWDEYSTGQITTDEAWQRIESQYEKSIALKQRNIWYTWEELTPIPTMVELVRSLKDKSYPVGLLSNVIPVTADVIRENGGYNGFDFQVLSYEAGARKPSPRIYETALSHLSHLQPDEILFLDDRERCVKGAEALGIQALHVTDHQKTIKHVTNLINT